jgi:hypothetical protein
MSEISPCALENLRDQPRVPDVRCNLCAETFGDINSLRIHLFITHAENTAAVSGASQNRSENGLDGNSAMSTLDEIAPSIPGVPRAPSTELWIQGLSQVNAGAEPKRTLSTTDESRKRAKCDHGRGKRTCKECGGNARPFFGSCSS